MPAYSASLLPSFPLTSAFPEFCPFSTGKGYWVPEALGDRTISKFKSLKGQVIETQASRDVFHFWAIYLAIWREHSLAEGEKDAIWGCCMSVTNGPVNWRSTLGSCSHRGLSLFTVLPLIGRKITHSWEMKSHLCSVGAEATSFLFACWKLYYHFQILCKWERETFAGKATAPSSLEHLDWDTDGEYWRIHPSFSVPFSEMWNGLAISLGKHSKVNTSFKRKVNHTHPEEARSSGTHIVIPSLFCTATSMVRRPTTRLLYTVRERMGLELSKWTQWECGMWFFGTYMLSWSIS